MSKSKELINLGVAATIAAGALAGCDRQAQKTPELSVEKTPTALFDPTLTSSPTETATMVPTETPTPEPTVELIAALPDWSTEYVSHHQGIYEKIDGKEYYTSQKQVNVNGETRNINLKLVEFDTSTKEWIPSYATVKELLDAKQYGSLLTLNLITNPVDATWMIRKGSEAEVSDLKRLETILNHFAALIEKEHIPPTKEVLSTLPMGMLRDYTDEHQLSVPPPTELASFEFLSWNPKFEELYAKPIYIDGVDILNTHSWVTLRRGNTDQIITGIVSKVIRPPNYEELQPDMFTSSPGVIWIGFDQGVVEEVRKHYPIASLEETIKSLSGIGNECWWMGFAVVKEYDQKFGTNYTKEQLSAWSDIKEYYFLLPQNQQNYVQQAIESSAKGDIDEMKNILSGKILWRMLGAYNN